MGDRPYIDAGVHTPPNTRYRDELTNYKIEPVTNEKGELKLGVHVGGGEVRMVEWAPQPGSQQAFLACPVSEVLLEGTRGGGKTDVLIMSFAQECGKGFGQEWLGVVFRRSYPQLTDVINKANKWFKRIFPRANYNKADHFWEWPDGEKLYLRHMNDREDYWNYHGWGLTWIGWEELTNWPDPSCYRAMLSCLRSTEEGIPRQVRSTCNPAGVGHNWVKARWQLPYPERLIGNVLPPIGDPNKLDASEEFALDRVSIHSDIRENLILLAADPNYRLRIAAAARNPNERKAWLYGSWDIVSGGMFDDLWNPKVHIVPGFPLEHLPRDWKVDRAYDHGQSRPFSVGWWAQSNGEPVEWEGRLYGTVKGDIYRIDEWYGWTGEPNEGVRMLSGDIAKGILDREKRMFPSRIGRVRPGPADASIFDRYEGEKSVAGDMEGEGVRWEAADKASGSRKHGWEQIRKHLKHAVPAEDGYREKPGMFIFAKCQQFIRTVPVLPRDDRDPDDVNTEAEDHIGDEVRYRCRAKTRVIQHGRFM